MKAFVITLNNDRYSNMVADRCIQSASKHGLLVNKFWGVKKEDAYDVMQEHELEWTWAGEFNNEKRNCPTTGLYQFPYKTDDIRKKIGCSMSHFLLWHKCVELNEPILILEHDAVFLKPLPKFDFEGICQINDPAGATRKGDWWSKQMLKRRKIGVSSKTWITAKNERHIPDGLAGNSAYVIKPHAASELTVKFYELGVWPNDATMCKQLFPYLEEYFPFITKVVQNRSTTV